jgi:hypothetical protein
MHLSQNRTTFHMTSKGKGKKRPARKKYNGPGPN